ncbi:choline ABC transporter ATP-binding protein [Phenylobacterium montanum]|uniref:Trimethylamine N-oxide transport system ATP-binding protein TmoW n=1 Tax=Phenylobacterium montanum TaxID=2823693 RepID=A0A975G045_9CAUL|nr:choline ABC transporter ATP-binding protein [Caulobacter sp. S6]QUD88678.1 choline ABC transporter ATP-binding protein [Caulobacter sp. S6]
MNVHAAALTDEPPRQEAGDVTTAVEFKEVDILFGKAGKGARDPAMAKAISLMEAGSTRSQIAAETGVVLGVAGANLTVRAGEISVLMGLSGSGKSTLLRAANGLNSVTRGQVLVRHQGGVVDVASCDAPTLREVRRKSIAMVFQQFALLPWRTVRDNVGLGLEFQGMDKAQRRRIVDEKLELVGLAEWADRKTQELSGGMQQRVGLARAFATDADILLMDEPFSALDPLIRSRLQDELISLQESVQKTIIFVSHDLDEALKLGDQITIMEGGRIVQTGDAQDIVLRPANDYVAQFVRHMNPLSVLTGATVMRGVDDLEAEAGGVWLDSRRRYRLELDADRHPLACHVEGEERVLLRHEPQGGPIRPDSMILAEAGLPLSAIIKICEANRHPVLLVENGRLLGVCGEAEILKALSGDR